MTTTIALKDGNGNPLNVGATTDANGSIVPENAGLSNGAPVTTANPMVTADAVADAALGTPSDAAWASGSGSVVAILKGIFGKFSGIVLGAGSAVIGAVTQSGAWTVTAAAPATTYQGTMTVPTTTSTALTGGNVTMASSTTLPAPGAFGKLTVINVGANPAYVFWLGGTASAGAGGEVLAPGASDTVNLTGAGAEPTFYSTAGTTLAFHN
jgi:hypothetical protein